MQAINMKSTSTEPTVTANFTEKVASQVSNFSSSTSKIQSTNISTPSLTSLATSINLTTSTNLTASTAITVSLQLFNSTPQNNNTISTVSSGNASIVG